MPLLHLLSKCKWHKSPQEPSIKVARTVCAMQYTSQDAMLVKCVPLPAMLQSWRRDALVLPVAIHGGRTNMFLVSRGSKDSIYGQPCALKSSLSVGKCL